MKKPLDLTGEVFGALTVLGRLHDQGAAPWRCQCVCGKEAMVRAGNLRQIKAEHCTCAQRNAARLHRTSHGASSTPEYRAWSEMKTRCTNPTSTSFAHYGGRGIRIDPRWERFEAFLADMGHKPTARHSLERNDVNGHYEPDNCRWATAKEQANNKRNNRHLTFAGVTLTMAQWAARLGWSVDMIERRVNLLGWSDEKALTTPPRGWGPGHPRRENG